MVDLRDLAPDDAGWLIMRHAELYTREAGFDHTFEPLVAEVMADFLRSHDPARARGWIAWEEGARLGSILCVPSPHRADTAKLRLFLLEPQARGRGLGRHLLQSCMDFARKCGYLRLALATHKSHEAACALYARTGFVMEAERPVHSFGCDLVEQNWAITL